MPFQIHLRYLFGSWMLPMILSTQLIRLHYLRDTTEFTFLLLPNFVKTLLNENHAANIFLEVKSDLKNASFHFHIDDIRAFSHMSGFHKWATHFKTKSINIPYTDIDIIFVVVSWLEYINRIMKVVIL